MNKKTIRLFIAGLFATVLASTAMADNAKSVNSYLDGASENVAPAFHQAPRQSESPALNYVNQPPMVPHAVANYQVTKNVNQCLNCHSPENARLTGATRISPTHFMDRDGHLGSNSSPRRYFCLQCHVSQSDVDPIVPNEFQPMKGYGK